MFHVAANAANGDERADGDYVYTVAREVSAARAPVHKVHNVHNVHTVH